MNTGNCDFSIMEQQFSEEIKQITNKLRELKSLGNEKNCLLSKLGEIKDKFLEVESIATSFYLNCYLSAFTDKYADLSLCVQRLSVRQHGALIAVQRRDSIHSIIQKGTDIGAALTPELLEAIFYPGNPLHDGAAVVHGNQIVSAANVLPLTNKVIIGRKLGTRHRAALGLSEQSDALVLVVSEETGRVSFALDGKLYPIATAHPVY
ncbi:sporulation-specific diadenylate cyclase CdaS [Metabacillus fastidiosus]|uniref:Diadenylate cyclase n=1 Tax=Metabacillus fastidiosus TaxID=1458 RepID=A0ABU6P295_9BACI|nr:sporulation-specific diadenylate cyclase CdaS [Metabacillus fastidiosus]MED4402266.1 sporulation-specific diadenylate cyclase CdaS [Metabacillus fastidiosus]MED4454913.1 sporulation-specific diadenylate cyclase CdaS [Metabacillus fastidiosus]MED4462137.1 sporulation-specific diadenylate cyclase CdaS [Metabacillus fastidiosus]